MKVNREMHVHADPFRLPKGGNSDEEYEDAYWPQDATETELSGPRLRFAVADGATEASFSKQWAELLVQGYCEGQLDVGSDARLARALQPLQQAWNERVSIKPLPWYAEEKAKSGAFSSLVGLTIYRRKSEIRWSSVAIGDSCLFHVRDGRPIASFPMECSKQFNNRPILISSNLASNDQLAIHIHRKHGTCCPEDAFYLMTDAIACWALSEHEFEQHPWGTLRDLGTDESPTFEEWVTALREKRAMRNDDVTLLRIDVF